MLRSLQVRNFAIVDQLDIDFLAGMTVLTGETGAGKSILVDALGLLLGDRGGAGLVRAGADRAELTAEFDLDTHEAAAHWLAEQSLDLEEGCLLRRVITKDGRSRAFINGSAVPLQTLKLFGELMADIHGQHFHQSLTKPSVQRDLLDHFAEAGELRAMTAEAFTSWRGSVAKLGALAAAESDRESRIELLRFQLEEISALDLAEGEYDSLIAESTKLNHAERLAEGLRLVLETIDEGATASARELIARASHEARSLAEIDAALRPAESLLDEAAIQVDEAATLVRRYSQELDIDPQRAQWVTDRIDAARSLARKHNVDQSELTALGRKLDLELDELQRLDQRTDALRAEVNVHEAAYLEVAERLSTVRRDAAAQLSSAVSEAMDGLGMSGGRFVAEVAPLPTNEANAHGRDRVSYAISANPGQEPMPLGKVASGGELSRMSLAIQVIVSDGSAIPTMVFDEVDSGVGGAVAEMVGRRLQELGRSRQVLCVTHLPQVASQADQHLRINKVSDGKATRSGVHQLSEDERVEELARMLGGVEVTERTRDHAAEMLARGGERGQRDHRASR